MANARGKSIDNTHLSVDTALARGFIHRDYVAHCLRWTYVMKEMARKQVYKTSRILDIGCGVDVPMAKTLYSSRYIVEHYIGMDWNHGAKLDITPFHTGKFPVDVFGRVDFASNQVTIEETADGRMGINVIGENADGNKPNEDFFYLPNVITCFEMVEHIEPAHVRAVLTKVRTIMNLAAAEGQTPIFYMSTPNYDSNVGHAANHVNEMDHNALGWLIEDCGLTIQREVGTFASQRDYVYKLFADYPGADKVYNALADVYDSNYLATIFAPLYPVEARNCLWTLGPSQEGYERKYPMLRTDGAAWSSSENWRHMFEGYADAYNPATGVV